MPKRKRRALVLTHESARHWFRRSLPPHVFGALLPEDAENREAARLWQVSGASWRGFLTAYGASLASVTLFIS